MWREIRRITTQVNKKRKRSPNHIFNQEETKYTTRIYIFNLLEKEISITKKMMSTKQLFSVQRVERTIIDDESSCDPITCDLCSNSNVNNFQCCLIENPTVQFSTCSKCKGFASCFLKVNGMVQAYLKDFHSNVFVDLFLSKKKEEDTPLDDYLQEFREIALNHWKDGNDRDIYRWILNNVDKSEIKFLFKHSPFWLKMASKVTKYFRENYETEVDFSSSANILRNYAYYYSYCMLTDDEIKGLLEIEEEMIPSCHSVSDSITEQEEEESDQQDEDDFDDNYYSISIDQIKKIILSESGDDKEKFKKVEKFFKLHADISSMNYDERVQLLETNLNEMHDLANQLDGLKNKAEQLRKSIEAKKLEEILAKVW